jgi:murein DD-endopeptidase MepM/ murein hydrolase activator NlpD
MRRAAHYNGMPSSVHGEPTRMGRYGKHLGYDYPVKKSLVPAPDDLVILRTYTGPVGGLTIEALDSQGRIHRFLHLDQVRVKEGQRVKEGHTIAVSGSTGVTTGPHCHHDVRQPNTSWTDGFDKFIDWENELVASLPTGESPRKQPHIEKIVGGLSFFVRTAPSSSAKKRVGVVLRGQRYETQILENGWRKLTFRGKVGFVGPAAFRKKG